MAEGNNTILIISIVLGVLAAIGGYVYLFGVPKEAKRWAEDKALNTMGENKASFGAKTMVDKIPEADGTGGVRKDVKNNLGTALQNPLGKTAGDTADDATKPLTGR